MIIDVYHNTIFDDILIWLVLHFLMASPRILYMLKTHLYIPSKEELLITEMLQGIIITPMVSNEQSISNKGGPEVIFGSQVLGV